MTEPFDIELRKVQDYDPESMVALVVKEDDDGELYIEWDETHPSAISLGINDWTEEQWIEALEAGLKRVEEEELKGDS